MTENQDNAGEVVAGVVRVALTAAGQLAEQAARRREADLREAERESAARVATLQSQLAAERELVLQSVHDMVQQGDAATVDEVVRAWEQARSWDDLTMGRERAQLEERIRERFGIDMGSLAAERLSDAQAAAAGVVTRGVALHVGDQHQRQRDAGRSRVAELRAELLRAGVAEETATARAIAAESHPASPALATQPAPAQRRLQGLKSRTAVQQRQVPSR